MRVQTEALNGERAAHIRNYNPSVAATFPLPKTVEQSGFRYLIIHILDMHESTGDIPTGGLPSHFKISALKGINCPGFRPLAGLN